MKNKMNSSTIFFSKREVVFKIQKMKLSYVFLMPNHYCNEKACGTILKVKSYKIIRNERISVKA